MFASKWKSEPRLRSVTSGNNTPYLPYQQAVTPAPQLAPFLLLTVGIYGPPIQRQLFCEFKQECEPWKLSFFLGGGGSWTSCTRKSPLFEREACATCFPPDLITGVRENLCKSPPIYSYQGSPIIEAESSQTIPAIIKIHGHLERRVCICESHQSVFLSLSS